MQVNLKTITPDIENIIVEIARVSSSRKDKTEKPEGLINYLIKNNHWSPFECGYITFEIETSKAIGIQLLRHRSFTFQEFSQRYQEVGKVSEDGMFEPIELRKQADNNRQSSEEVFEPELPNMVDIMVIAVGSDSTYYPASDIIDSYLEGCQNMYEILLKSGVAREQARMVLPMCTKTRIYMTGSVRSWIHFLSIRDDAHAQKEIQLIAKDIKRQLVDNLPIVSRALGW